jgi:ATP phosphoribosyltransferase regulatory subunit
LPSEARRIEALRRVWLDLARSFGFELVMPPLLEHLDSLLSGTGEDLDLKTFKLVDQLSGRTLGVRADTTPQVARIDAHLLNRAGVTRLCYCGPVLHTRPSGLHASREPLQFGVELFGHAGLEADLEIQQVALEGLLASQATGLALDLGDARLVRALLAGVVMDVNALTQLVSALTAKDTSLVSDLTRRVDPVVRQGLLSLMDLYGGEEVIDAARERLPRRPMITEALDDLAWLSRHLRQLFPQVKVGFDLSDMGGYSYYSGVRFVVFGAGGAEALARGGRYDEVGAVFGRNRNAVGCSLDLKSLAAVLASGERPRAIRAAWCEGMAFQQAARALRAQGLAVVNLLPGEDGEAGDFLFDQALQHIGGQWVVRPC